MRGSSTVIVGIGNVLKGDDAAGPLICEQLRRTNVSAHVIDAGTVPENYIRTIIRKNPQNLLLIDAIDFDGKSGEISVFKPEQLSSLVISTHTLSPRIFIDLIRKSIELEVYCIGIQPVQTQLGTLVSEQVNRAIHELCRILTEIFPPGL